MSTVTPNRYTGVGRLGANRPMTQAETQTWTQAVARWRSNPPWTEQVQSDNATVAQMLVTLFEDGVSLSDLAATAGWGKAKVSGILHRARQAGLGTGTRRYIAPEPTVKADKDPYRRPLTGAEAAELAAAYANLPVHASGSRGWKNPTGQALAARIEALHNDRVTLDSIGDVLGMSRQAIHDRLAKAQATPTRTRAQVARAA